MTSFLSDKRGNIAVMFGVLSLPILVGVGLAIDYSSGSNMRGKLQNAADAAAIGATALSTTSQSARIEEAVRLFQVHYELAGLPGDPPSTDISTESGSVTVTVNGEMPTRFMRLAGIENMKLNVGARAVPVEQTPICLLALTDSAPSAVRVAGAAGLEAVQCAVHANSTHGAALRTQGAASASASRFCARGGHEGNGFTPTPEADCNPVEDPFAALPVPSDMACDHTGTNLSGGTHALSPGVYCGGLEIGSHATADLAPGLYILRDGPLTMRAHSKVVGEDVTFYFHGDDARLDIKSHSTMDLKAPASGPYHGVAMTQHPGSSAGMTSELAGGGSIRIVGALHFPTQTLDIGGASGIDATSPFMPLVADRFDIRGNGKLTVNADAEAAGFDDLLPQMQTGARLTH